MQVELAPIVDSDLVATAIADTLGLGEMPGKGPAEALIAYLRGRRVLFVLDNFEQVLAAAPLLAELLAGAPGVTLLVTSRAPLDIREERIYPVAALELPDSSAPRGRTSPADRGGTAVRRSRAQRRADFELSDLNAGAVAELCLRLTGCRFALELAAARIKLLSPGDILERLGAQARGPEGRCRAQAARPAPDAARRDRVELRPPRARRSRRSSRASASSSGASRWTAPKAVAGDLELDVVAGVESLLNNSLLRTEPMAAGEPRFGMLETIREYACERLAERGDEQVVRRRHAGFCRPLAEEAEPALRGPQQLRWLERLDAERDNLRAALNWAAEEGEADIGLRIGAALWRFWQMRAGDVEGPSISTACSPALLARLLSAPTRNRGLPASPITRGTSTASIATSRRASPFTASWATTGAFRPTSRFSP